MTGGTTPTFTFSCPFLSTELSKVNIIITQSEDVYIVKKKNDCTIVNKTDLSGSSISVKLTEMETLALNGGADFKTQMFVKLNNASGDIYNSQVVVRTVDESLKFGVIQ